MKTLRLLISAVAVAAVASALAQSKPGSPVGPKTGQGQHNGNGARGMMANPELQKKLALTAAQKKKLEALNKSMRDQFMKMKPEDRRTKGRDMFMKYRKDTEAVLTAKQKAILLQWRKDHPMRRPGAAGARPGGSGRPGAAPGKKGGN